MSKKKNILMAQGTIEYLVIIAVIVVIGLVIVALISNLVGSPATTITDASSKLSQSSGGVSIYDAVVDTNGKGLISLVNNTGGNFTITKISLSGMDSDYGTGQTLTQGDKRLFELSNIGSACACAPGDEGKKKKCTLIVTGVSAYGLSKQTSFEISVNCINNTNATDQNKIIRTIVLPPILDITPPVVTLTSPSPLYGTTSNTIDFNFVVSDSNTIRDCNFIINGDINGTGISNPAKDVNLTFTRNLLRGNVYRWDVNCTDVAGNVGTSGEGRWISVDFLITSLSTPYAWITRGSSVLKVDVSTYQVVGDYNANGSIHGAYGIALDSDGNAWVPNSSGDNNIIKLNKANGNPICSYYYNAGRAITFYGVAVDEDNNVWVASYTDGNVLKLRGSDCTLLGNYSTGASTNYPYGVTVSRDNKIWVSGASAVPKVYVFNSAGTLTATFSKSESISSKSSIYFSGEDFPTAHFAGPSNRYYYGIAYGSDRNIWVAQGGNTPFQAVKYKGTDGTNLGTITVGTSPKGIAADGVGNIWVTNSVDNTVSKISIETGTVVGTYAVGLTPVGIAIDSNQNVWVVNSGQLGAFTVLRGSDGGVLANMVSIPGAPIGAIGFGDMTGYALQKFVLRR